jgi:hypothetical protein
VLQEYVDQFGHFGAVPAESVAGSPGR